MYDAFIQAGHEVELLEGQQNRPRERTKKIRRIVSWLKTNRPDICYIEPPSGPVFHAADIRLIRKVSKMGVPIALFYRDAHWLYADWWGVTGAKAILLKAMHKRDIKAFQKYCDVIYFPSRSMAALFHGYRFKHTDVLPPACEKSRKPNDTVFGRMIYVGGIRPAYGTDILLSAFRRLHEMGRKVELYLVCREAEMANLKGEGYDDSWLKVFHAEGKELTSLYSCCDAGLIPLRRDRYMDFAIPIKLFEYLENGLPVIATDCTEVKKFVQTNGCGIVCQDRPEVLAQAIAQFYDQAADRAAMIKNVSHTASSNRWIDRADKVVKDLSQFLS